MTMDEFEDYIDVLIEISKENEILKFFDNCRNFMSEGKLTDTLYKLREI